MTAAEEFRDAFEKGAVPVLAPLLRADVVLEMPPATTWFAGHDAVTSFLASELLTEPGMFRLIPVAANGQPAFAVYQRDTSERYRSHSVIVVTVRGELIARITMFRRSRLFDLFRLPEELAGRGASEAFDG